MEITTTTVHEIRWDFPDANEFNATITNGKITELFFRDVGDLTNRELCSTNEKYLRNVYKALHGLLQYLDETRNVGNGKFSVNMDCGGALPFNDFGCDIKQLDRTQDKDDDDLGKRVLFIKH